MLCTITTASTNNPVDNIFSELAPTTPPTIKTIAVTDTIGNTDVHFVTIFSKNLCAKIPRTIGTITTLIIDINIADADTGIHCPASNNVNIGVIIGARTVETIVIPTDNAISPLAKNVITFDDVPPGHVPTNTTPTANSAGKLNNFANINANKGIIVN